MKYFRLIGVLATALCLSTSSLAKETIRVITPFDDFQVDVFADGNRGERPAIIVLSGSKGFGSPAYDKIAQTFVESGLDVYLAHLITAEDLQHITDAKDAGARIKYYEERRRDWMRNLGGLTLQLSGLGYKGRIGVLGISLGAETAAMAVSQGLKVDAVVLVDGAPQRNDRFATESLPPFHLIWGSDDTVFPLSSGQSFMRQLTRAGGTATMTITEGAKHDFFLQADTVQANAAYKNAIDFFQSQLKR